MYRTPDSAPRKTITLATVTAAVLAVAAAGTATAASPNTQLGEVVVTGKFISPEGQSALKMDVPMRDVPITVSDYTNEFMNSIETTRISDLYNYMTGVQRAGTTAYDVTIRGFASGGADRNTIMVDGLPGQAVRFGSPPTISAASVEVVKGPASILYGQVQPGGFINIISKKPEDYASTMVKLRTDGYSGNGASFNGTSGYTASFDSTGPIDQAGKFLYRVIGEYGDEPGFRNFGKDDIRYLVPSFTYNISDVTRATASVEYRKETAAWDDGMVAPNNSNGVPDWHLMNRNLTTYYHEPGNTNTEEGTVLGLTIDHEFARNIKWRTSLRSVDHKDSRVDLDFQGVRTCSSASVAGQLDPTDICVRRRQRDQLNKRTYNFIDSNVALDLGSGWIAHKVLFGVNGGEETTNFKRNDFGSSNNTYDISIYHPMYGQGTPNPPKVGTWNGTDYKSYAAYLQDQMSLGKKWKLLAGLRYEKFDIVNHSFYPPTDPNYTATQKTDGSAAKPMVGVLYQPNDRWSYYVSYATSFNPPAPGRLDVNGNIFTSPEEGLQYETGVKADLLNKRVSATFSIFQITKKNSLQQIGTTGVWQMTGEERSEGAELEIDAQVTERWQMIAGYSFIDAKVLNDVRTQLIGQQLRNVPKNSANVWNRIALTPALSLGLGASFRGKRYGTVPNTGGTDRRLVLPAYTVVDLALYYTNQKHGIDATLKVGNLLNEWYLESAFTQLRITPGAPRNVVFTISKRW